ncbi:hypothetical protein P879_02393 [Paragonimus westermani]|uniref:Tyrosinase copper-binding domain-containing protein n=1 Tax=Paragonimus westermani TaxID=34504 RepID=A0A8T0DVL4_9TREM|nr:hypothetical protein P879_02393 [Paragonimus westermani]
MQIVTKMSWNWLVLSVVLISSLQLWSSKALIPKVCVQNITALGGSGICCPIPKGSNQACGGPGIGTCERQFIQLEPLPKHRLLDDRMHWPSRFFKYTCKCEGRYFGLACDECWYGWSGRLCNKRKKYVRRDIMSYSPKERQMFVDIVAETTRTPTDYVILFEKDPIHSDPLWKPKFMEVDLQYLIAFIHDYASRGTMYKDEKSCKRYKKLDNNHNVVGFATWHRYFMLVWENELRKIASKKYGWYDFAAPYWDWVDAKKCDVCVNSLVGAPGPYVNGIRLIHPASPFSNWTEQCTMPKSSMPCKGCHTTWPYFKPLHRDYVSNAFPTTKDLHFTLSRPKFYLPQKHEDLRLCRGFHQTLEGFCGEAGTDGQYMYMHNKVHNMVRGSFCCAPTAANDPLFILHHSQIDRVMQIWFEHYRPSPTDFPNHGVEYGNCRECNLIGFIPTVRHNQMFVDMRQLGVYYDNYKFGKFGFDGDEFIKYGPAYYHHF